MPIFDLFRRKVPAADPATSALRLRLAVRTRRDEQEWRSSGVFTLAEGFDLREAEGATEVCDYRSRRILSLHPAEGAYTDESLGASVLFRAMEFSNREALVQLLKAGYSTPDGHHMKTALSRHILAQGPGDAPELRWSGLAADAEGERLYERSRQGWKQPAWAIERLLRLIRREHGGHPEIFQRLAEQGEIPRSLTLRFRDPSGDVTETTIQAEGCEIVPAPPAPSIAGLRWRLGADEEDALWTGLAAARAGGPLGEADQERTSDEIQAHLEAERWVPAALTVLEATWLHPSLPPELIQGLSSLGQSVEDVGRLIAAFQPRGAGEVEAQIAELEGFRALGADKAHVIDVLQASLLGQARRERGPAGLDRVDNRFDRDAEARYRAALLANPRLAGPYHDLGFLHMRAYRCEDAFRCWDFARWLSPDHPIHSDVERLEHDLWADEAAIPHGRLLPG